MVERSQKIVFPFGYLQILLVIRADLFDGTLLLKNLVLASFDHRGAALAYGFKLIIHLLELVFEHEFLREGILIDYSFIQFDHAKSVTGIAGVITRIVGALNSEAVDLVKTSQAARLFEPIAEGLPFGTYTALRLRLTIDQPCVSLLKSHTS